MLERMYVTEFTANEVQKDGPQQNVCRNKVVPIAHRWTFLVPQILTWLDIAISIGGFLTVSKKASNQLLPTAWSRASTGIMAIIFLYTVGVFAYFWLHRHQFAQEEHRLAMCVGVCEPLLLIRVLYSVIFVVTADLTWNAVKGSPNAYLAYDDVARSSLYRYVHIYNPKHQPDGDERTGQQRSTSAGGRTEFGKPCVTQ